MVLTPELERLVEEAVSRRMVDASQQMRDQYEGMFGLNSAEFRSQPRSFPLAPWQKMEVKCVAGGGMWNPHDRTSIQYAAHAEKSGRCTKHKKLYGCECWTPDFEHRLKFSLKLCECEPPQIETRTGLQTATMRGDTYRVLEEAAGVVGMRLVGGDVTNAPVMPRHPRGK